MKILPAALFIAVGIWITYTYPGFAQIAFDYIQQAIDWIVTLFNNLKAQ